eukprot:Phypoly_transcript_03421.p1 GENE.Phypoly_transcript_03421~~Phypoly_transcript_03421.p1  ORF type:complete len:588 (+),score=83.63 Phypoly_transcript_03421:104-1867(+)
MLYLFLVLSGFVMSVQKGGTFTVHKARKGRKVERLSSAFLLVPHPKMMKLLCLVALVVCINADVAIKNLAGPPSEFSDFTFPTPLHSADIQNSATFYVNLAPSTSESNVLEQQLTLSVDSTQEYSFVFYSPFNESVKLSLKNPQGHSLILHGKTTQFPLSDGAIHVTGTEYRFKNPKTGDYTLTVKSPPLSDKMYHQLSSNIGPDAYVLLWNEDSLSTHTALNTYSLLTGNKVGLVSRVFTESFSLADMRQGKAPTAIRGSVKAAEMTVVYPDGQTIDEPMSDDGLHSDGDANDGVYGGLITATEPGQYIFSATLQGTNSEGVNYIRTTQQLVTVVAPITLTGSAQGALDHSSNTRMNIYISTQAPNGNKYKAYTEVWGTDSDGNAVAVAWIGGMTIAQDNTLALELDLNWLSMAGAQEPLVLRNVVIQDVDTFVPIAQAEQIPVKASSIALALHMATLSLLDKNGEITEEMREGIRPAKYALSSNLTATSAAIILIHGYCTDKNPFSVYPEDWSNAHFYLEGEKNFPHDAFSLNVLDWSESFGPYSYFLTSPYFSLCSCHLFVEICGTFTRRSSRLAHQELLLEWN